MQPSGVSPWQAIAVIPWPQKLPRRRLLDWRKPILKPPFGRIYQLLDVRPAAYWHGDLPEAGAADLIALHGSIRACQPVTFGYTDFSGLETTRTVLPLALVHPPQGVKLLAWCEERRDFRQFFVRAVQGLTRKEGDFSEDRLVLLRGLLDKEASRA